MGDILAAGDRAPRPDLSLVIPCYNEEEVLRQTVVRIVETFRQQNIDLELVVVDNGSTDATGAVIDELLAAGYPIVKRIIDVNIGYGNGILSGLDVCRGRFVGVLHADGQVEASDVFKVYDIAAHAKSPALVKVRRRFRMDGLTRKLVSIAYNAVINVLFPGLRSIDVNGSPRIFPVEYLRPMRLESQDWFLDPEVLIKARRLGLQIIEFNVLSQMRDGGKSHVHLGTCWEFVVNLMLWRLGLKGRPPGKHGERRAAGRHVESPASDAHAVLDSGRTRP